MLVMLECTERCNFNCIYCYQRNKIRGTRWMDFDLLRTIFSKAKHFLARHAKRDEMIHFEWTGGEPLLLGADYFERAFELEAEVFKNMMGRVRNIMQTNGSMITKRYIDLFKLYRVGVGVSTDVIGKTRVRGRKDMNPLVLKKLKLMQEEGFKFGCIVVLSKRNAKHLKRIYRMLREMHVPFHLNYLKQFVDYDADIMLSPKELAKVMLPVIKEYINDRVNANVPESFMIRNIDNDIRLAIGEDISKMTMCSYGLCFKNFLSIEVDGSAYPCTALQCEDSYLGNVRTSSFRSLMEHPFRKNLKRRRRFLAKLCADCDLISGCSGGCMADAYHNGNMLGAAPFACEYRRLIVKGIRKFMLHKGWISYS